MTPTRWPLIAVLAAVAAPYSVGLANGFVWLDHREILDGALIVRSPAEAVALVRGDRNYEGYFRPVYNLLHSIDFAVWGERAFGFHLSSLLLHLATVAFVRGIATRLGLEPRRALLLALVWGLHPVLTPAVGLIHAKADLAVGAALGASLACFLARGPAALRHAGALATFAVALYAKETAYVFGPALVLFLRPLTRARQDARRYVAGVLVLTVLAAAHRAIVVPDGAYASPLALGERLLTFATVYVDGIANLLWPAFPSVADTTTSWSARSDAAQLGYAAAFLALVALQAVAAWKRPSARVWVALLNLGLLPVAQIVPILHFRADRFFYLPSLGFVGLVLDSLAALAHRPRFAGIATARGGWLGAWAAVLVLFVALDVRTLRAFGDDVALMGREVAREPRYREGWSVLARDAEGRGDLEVAAALYQRSLASHDIATVSYVDGSAVVVNLTATWLRLGRYSDVLDIVERLGGDVRGEEARLMVGYNRAVATFRLDRPAEAREAFEEFLTARPGDLGAHDLAGRAAAELGDVAGARAHFQRYLELAPPSPARDAVTARLAALDH